jgi:dolichol-phosphate mannosyltransferase
MTRRLVSFCIPVYNEAPNVEGLLTRLQATARDLSSYDFEFLFTDNRSTDNTVELLEVAAKSDPRVRVLRLSRNFGFQRSILMNYLNARGDAVIQVDADLQDPPEMASDFLALWEHGYKVVYGVRRRRKEGWAITLLRRLGYAFIDRLSETHIPPGAGDFRLIDRVVIEALRTFDDRSPYLRGLIAELGFKQIGVQYDREGRAAGESKFGLKDLLGLGFDGLFSTSMVPLRIASWVGIVAVALSTAGVLYYIYLRYADPRLALGIVSLHILVLISIGLNAILLGIIGEYVGRIFRNTRGGPLALVDESSSPTNGQELQKATAEQQ